MYGSNHSNCLPSTSSPFSDWEPVSITGTPNKKLDAIFVPCHRAESRFINNLEELSSTTEYLYILPSGSATNTFKNKHIIPNNVRIVSNEVISIAHQHFINKNSSQNPSQSICKNYDLPAKRNIALHLSRQSGLQRICLLDDDITITTNQIFSAAAALSNDFPLAGFYVFDFPDVSTIDHIHRMTTRQASQTLPGGNCLFLMPERVTGFFPYVYNEDWLFVLHNMASCQGHALGAVKQDKHTPWNDANRVRFEEFGEVIISGLLPLPRALDCEESTSLYYWESLYVGRRRMLENLRDTCTEKLLRKMVSVALDSLAQFGSPELVRFILDVKEEIEDYSWI